MTATWDRFPIEVRIATLPDGRDGVLMQFEHGFIITAQAGQVDDLADALRAVARELRSMQAAGDG